MQPRILLTQFQDHYTQQVIDIISTIQQKEYKLEITPEQQPDLKVIPSVYQKRKGNFWVALHQDKVVGTIALKDLGNNEAALKRFFVRKEFRGKEKGISRQLLEQVLDWSKQHGIQKIYLGTTLVFLAAHRFYEKNGFVEIGKDDLPNTFPLISIDEKFYAYEVA